MKIGIIGGSNQQRSLPFDAQRTVNLFATADQQGAESAALYGTPGLELFATAGSGPVRGSLASSKNLRAFAVSDSSLYEIDSSGAQINWGSLDTSSGIVTMADNGSQLMICDGAEGYIFTYATNVFEKITDADFPTAGGVDFVDGYFVVNEVGTGKFYISGLYDGLSWDALDFASAESSPDNLVRAVNFIGYLGLFGSNTLELWRNTGDSVFPFSRVSGSTPVGSQAPYTITSLDTSVYWVGATEQGDGLVYKASGFSPKVISNSDVERALQAVTQPELLRSWTYQEEGHLFLVITGADLETSWVMDIATELWHERAFLETDGTYSQHLGSCCMNAFGKQLVGDRRTGKIYNMSQDIYTDNGDYIKRLRIYTHLIDEKEQVRYSTLKINLESGVGLQTGQGSDPLISLRLSKDGARTWSDYYTTEMGAVGKYQTESNFRRLGISTIMTFELSTSEPVRVAWIGSYLN